LPTPEPQFIVLNHLGFALGRADFGWPEMRTIGEFDGAGKYGRLLAPGARPGDAVFREKVREDEIRDAGWQVARWTTEDLENPQAVVDRIRRAFDRGQRSH
jgi:very-short-patch-repair endonuclease